MGNAAQIKRRLADFRQFRRIVLISDNGIREQGGRRGGETEQQENRRYGILCRVSQSKAENDPGIKHIIERRVKKNAEIRFAGIFGNRAVQRIKGTVDKNAEQGKAVHSHGKEINCQQADNKPGNRNRIRRNAGLMKLLSCRVKTDKGLTVKFCTQFLKLLKIILDFKHGGFKFLTIRHRFYFIYFIAHYFNLS